MCNVKPPLTVERKYMLGAEELRWGDKVKVFWKNSIVPHTEVCVVVTNTNGDLVLISENGDQHNMSFVIQNKAELTTI